MVVKILNIINMLIFITCLFVTFGSRFLSYGYDVISHLITKQRWPSRNDHLRFPGDFVFPNAALCDVNEFGPAGVPREPTTICYLPLNNITKYLFIAVW